MTLERDELRRLHYINALFAHVTGQDLFLANQIKSAIGNSGKFDPKKDSIVAKLLRKPRDH